MIYFYEYTNKVSVFICDRGDDCEGWAQSYITVHNTIRTNLSVLQKDPDLEQFKDVLVTMFAFSEYHKSPCMARGIFVHPQEDPREPLKEDHHTFNVVQHRTSQSSSSMGVYLSVIENVVPTVILPPGFDAGFVQQVLNEATRYDHVRTFVIPYSSAKRAYESILWIGEHMVFEYRSSDRRMYHGVRAYTLYDMALYLDDDASVDKFKGLEAASGATGTWLVYIKPGILCTHYSYFAQFGTDTHTVAKDIVELGVYFQFIDLFIVEHIKQLYNEDTRYVRELAQDFLASYETRIRDTPHDTTCLTTGPHKIDIFTIIIGAWCDAEVPKQDLAVSYKAKSVVVPPIVRPQLGVILAEIRRILSTLQDITQQKEPAPELSVQRQCLLDLIREQRLVGDVGDKIHETVATITAKCNIVKQLFLLYMCIRNILRYQRGAAQQQPPPSNPRGFFHMLSM